MFFNNRIIIYNNRMLRVKIYKNNYKKWNILPLKAGVIIILFLSINNTYLLNKFLEIIKSL